jgi:transcriptional regulator with XRE-family HTH domain
LALTTSLVCSQECRDGAWQITPTIDGSIYTSGCRVCARNFVKAWSEQAHCSTACARADARHEVLAAERVGVTAPPRCRWCGTYFEPDDPKQIYCSARCYQRANALQAAERAEPALAVKIRDARMALRLTQQELAERAGISVQYVSLIERGKAPMPADLRPGLFAALELDENGDPTEVLPPRICRWCHEPIPAGRPSAAVFCSQAHQRKWHGRRQRQKLSAKRAAARAAREAG